MRAWIYDRLFKGLSSHWYKYVIEYLPRQARVLDVGIGTGSSLFSQFELIKKKEMSWLGIDINDNYLKACQEEITQQNASDYIKVKTQSIYDLDETDKLDAIYFSASFMLLPDQKNALLIAMQSLKDDGVICFTQTFETRITPIMEVVKPLLKKITTVDFGVVTYEEPFLQLLSECGLVPIHNEVMGTQGPREMRIIVAKLATTD
jgi:ubiquinone/menaquinone biosynthesis C-methylase UbiE